MTNIKWNDGPPPFVGWWRTRLADYGFEDFWRWWDGEQWSTLAFNSDSANAAATYARIKTKFPISQIQWCDYWPENARVPRLDSTHGEWAHPSQGEGEREP